MKYEPWFQFTKKIKNKILLSDICDAALNMYDIYAAWPEWLSSYGNQSPDRFVKAVDGKESEWAPSLPAGNINTSVMWPVTSVYQLMKHRARWVEVGYVAFSHLPLFEIWSVSFFLLAAKAGLDSSAQQGGATECVTTPPTQSWSGTVFKKGKQSQNSVIWLR